LSVNGIKPVAQPWRPSAARKHTRGFVLSALGVILASAAPAGCTLWSKPAAEPISVSSTGRGAAPASFPSAASSKPAPDELPSKQTARLCAATAEDMQKKGFTEQAIFLYEKARESDPAVPNVAHHLALLYDQQGDGSRSLNEFKRALVAAPKDPDLLNDFGYYYYHRGNMTDAENWYRKALAIAPNHASALSNLAIVLGHQRRYQESIEMFTRVVGPAAAYSNVGVLMTEQGDSQQARDAFMQAMRLDKSLKQPQAFLAYLDQADHARIAATPAVAPIAAVVAAGAPTPSTPEAR
jgi:Tfp pilus assembly protein PilF